MKWWALLPVAVLLGIVIGDAGFALTYGGSVRREIVNRWWTIFHWRVKITVFVNEPMNAHLVKARMTARTWSPLSNELMLYGRSTRGLLVWSPWEDEGKTWCRGWSGPAVDALKTVLVLSEAA